jgi:nicotinate-nucleotide adenylyltransferase
LKTGLFFGSFNPVHIGHMAIANYLVEFTDLEQVWFVVSPHNPLKEKKSLLADYHRLRLIQEAIGDDKRFKASDIEFKMPQPSYTILSLAFLKEKYPGKEFALIIGSDNLLTLHKWKNYEEILKQMELYVYPRLDAAEEVPSEIKGKVRINFVKAPVMEISSTFIRDAIRAKKDIRHFLPEGVFRYLQEMHFYEK